MLCCKPPYILTIPPPPDGGDSQPQAGLRLANKVAKIALAVICVTLAATFILGLTIGTGGIFPLAVAGTVISTYLLIKIGAACLATGLFTRAMYSCLPSKEHSEEQQVSPLELVMKTINPWDVKENWVTAAGVDKYVPQEDQETLIKQIQKEQDGVYKGSGIPASWNINDTVQSLKYGIELYEGLIAIAEKPKELEQIAEKPKELENLTDQKRNLETEISTYKSSASQLLKNIPFAYATGAVVTMQALIHHLASMTQMPQNQNKGAQQVLKRISTDIRELFTKQDGFCPFDRIETLNTYISTALQKYGEGDLPGINQLCTFAKEMEAAQHALAENVPQFSTKKTEYSEFLSSLFTSDGSQDSGPLQEIKTKMKTLLEGDMQRTILDSRFSLRVNDIRYGIAPNTTQKAQEAQELVDQLYQQIYTIVQAQTTDKSSTEAEREKNTLRILDQLHQGGLAPIVSELAARFGGRPAEQEEIDTELLVTKGQIFITHSVIFKELNPSTEKLTGKSFYGKSTQNLSKPEQTIETGYLPL